MSLRKHATSGAFWNALSYGSQAAVQVLRLSVLTRFLDKSDFGLVAIVVLILGFTRLFADLGISTALFSRNDISKKEYSSLYWVGILLSLFLYLLLILLSPLIASFYSIDLLGTLIPILGLDLIISTTGRQFRVFYQKALKFKSLALIDVSSSVVSLVAAVYFAYIGLGVYSLIYSTLLASLLSAVCLIIVGIKRHPISLYLNLKESKPFYKIGFYQTGSQILDYFASQLDILLMSNILPISDLGVYNLLKQFVLKLYAFLNSIFSNVTIPLLAKVNDNIARLTDNYLLLTRLAAILNTTVFSLIALLATNVLTIVYGAQYVEHRLLLQLMCIWGTFISVVSMSSIIVTVTGKTDLGFKWTIFRVIYNPPFILIGAIWGLEGILIGQLLYAATSIPLYWLVLIRKVVPAIDFRRFMLNTLSPILSAILVGYLLDFTTSKYLHDSLPLTTPMISVVLFCFLFFLINRGNIVQLIGLFLNHKR